MTPDEMREDYNWREAFKYGVAPQPCEGFVAAHDRQLRALSEEYPEFPEALELLRASMLHAEACWQGPGAER